MKYTKQQLLEVKQTMKEMLSEAPTVSQMNNEAYTKACLEQIKIQAQQFSKVAFSPASDGYLKDFYKLKSSGKSIQEICTELFTHWLNN